MSKKSRRRARRAREKEAIRIVQLRMVGSPSDFAEAVKMMTDAIPWLFQTTANAIDRVIVWMSTMSTGWPDTVHDACIRGDALPLLVYADWCAENNRLETESLARKVAGAMVDPPRLIIGGKVVGTITDMRRSAGPSGAMPTTLTIEGDYNPPNSPPNQAITV